jgi:hypothetical protein
MNRWEPGGGIKAAFEWQDTPNRDCRASGRWPIQIGASARWAEVVSLRVVDAVFFRHLR